MSLKEALGTTSNPNLVSPSSSSLELAGLILAEIKAIEIGYAQGNCREVVRRGEELRKLMPPVHSNEVPLSILSAVSSCAAQFEESDIAKLSRAQFFIAESLKTLVPPWDRIRLLEIQSILLAKHGKIQEAIDIRKEIDKELRSFGKKRMENNFALAELSAEYRLLSSFEQQSIREICSLASKDEDLFAALHRIESLEHGAAEGDSPISLTLQRIKEPILLRIDDLYYLESRQLVNLLQSGPSEEAQEVAQILRKKFPRQHYFERTSDLLSSYGGSKHQHSLQGASARNDEQAFSSLSPEDRISLAKIAINDGKPEQAINLLRAIPIERRSTSEISLLNDAESSHIRNLRLRVKDILAVANQSEEKNTRLEKLTEAVKVLQFILKEYPTSDVRKQIERNIRSIQTQLQSMR